MGSSDLDTLLEMGFEKERAEIAVKKSGGIQGALEWLETNQDKSLEELKPAAASDETDPTTEPPDLKPGEEARSLVCNECGKRFRSQPQAEFHASKTEHVDFSESTEEIAPLTDEEKKAKLEELRKKLAEKRAGGSVIEKEEKMKNDAIRRKATKETADLKEDLQKKEQLKIAAAKRREKAEDIAAKERIRAKIKADQEERRLRTEKEKAEREGRPPPQQSQDNPSSSATPKPAAAAAAGATPPKPASAYSESRLRLQTPSGNLQKSFPVETTLFEVAAALEQDSAGGGMQVQSFTQNFPKKVFSAGVDFGQTLKEAGLVPSAALIVR
ncbi:MAG: hypothetical protein M1837_006035 [Sclerophora amabilis]|nr:MAG: hypothetical protein M1837_006035 [Sclerophora amabilis]